MVCLYSYNMDILFIDVILRLPTVFWHDKRYTWKLGHLSRLGQILYQTLICSSIFLPSSVVLPYREICHLQWQVTLFQISELKFGKGVVTPELSIGLKLFKDRADPYPHYCLKWLCCKFLALYYQPKVESFWLSWLCQRVDH